MSWSSACFGNSFVQVDPQAFDRRKPSAALLHRVSLLQWHCRLSKSRPNAPTGFHGWNKAGRASMAIIDHPSSKVRLPGHRDVPQAIDNENLKQSDVRPFGPKWRAGQNRTANTYFIEINR